MHHAIALGFFSKITYARYKKLIAKFGTVDTVWEAELPELVAAGIEEHIATEFIVWREHLDTAHIERQLETEGVTAVPIGHDSYPARLAQINDPPIVLFVRGVLPTSFQPMVAVIGTRKCTQYGRVITKEIASALAKSGVAVVSGLALGIDGIAHEAALEVHGTTVAVLGSGVDALHVHPATHRRLAEAIIAEGGALVSEYPPGFMPTSYSFPARNRIIAGLSQAVLVTEAPTESGALITARAALDYNRDIFAVPHLVTAPEGAGCNNLIKMGATLVTSASDVLDELNIEQITQSVEAPRVMPSNPTEAILFPHLSKEPIHIDLLIKASRLSSGVVMGALTLLEMKGVVRNMGGMRYTLKR